jgi:hypothetical protein
MRTPSPKPKREQHVELPEYLLAFLREVGERVEARDEATVVESDDLLQTESVYGGRDSEATDRFSFTYFPEPGVRQKWQFSLTENELIAIAHGAHLSLRLWSCTQPDCRSMFEREEGPECFYCDWEGPVADG